MAEQEKVVGFVGIERVRADRSAGHYVIGGSRPSAAQTTCLSRRSLSFALATREPTSHNNEVSARAGRWPSRPYGHPPGRGSCQVSGSRWMVCGIHFVSRRRRRASETKERYADIGICVRVKLCARLGKARGHEPRAPWDCAGEHVR